MIIAIANTKGGCGKTTTVDMMATMLLERGKKILAIDGDWQAELTRISGAKIKDKTLYDVIINKVDIEDAIVENTASGYHIIPGSIELLYANRQPLLGVLKDALSSVIDQYDYIIIDSPATPGSQLKLCLDSADCIIVPTQGHRHDCVMLEALALEIKEAMQDNGSLYVSGILQTFHNPENTMDSRDKEYLNIATESLKTKLFEARIMDMRAVTDFSMYKNSYALFVDEFLKET